MNFRASFRRANDGSSSGASSPLRLFLCRQYSTIASLALEYHFSSRRRSSKVAVRKYFCPLCAGCPSGFNKPLVISLLISSAVKPRNQAACSRVRRPGGLFRFKKRSTSCCIYTPTLAVAYPPLAMAGKSICHHGEKLTCSREVCGVAITQNAKQGFRSPCRTIFHLAVNSSSVFVRKNRNLMR